MNPLSITLAAFSGAEPDLAAVTARLRRAWRDERSIEFDLCPPEALAAREPEAIDAVVLAVSPADAVVDATRILARLREAHVPVVGLRTGDIEPACPFQAASVICFDADVAGEVLAAALAALVQRQTEIAELQRDLEITRRFHGGLGAEMGRLLEELQLAAMVQRDYLPPELPTLHGVEFSALWRPANYVSGDIYDIAQLDDDRVGVFLADAVGHGVPAALMTMVIHQSLCTHNAKGEVLPPSEVLRILNQGMIRRQHGNSRFATAVYGIVDCRARTICVAGAGHPPPLLLHPSGDVSSLDTSGGLLGIFPDETFPEETFEIGVDDRLLVFSDGFEQAFPARTREEDCEDPAYERRKPTLRYRDEFELLRELPTSGAMIDALEHRVDQQVGSLHQIDDLTLVCMRAGAIAQADAADEDADPVDADASNPLRRSA